MDNRAPNDGRSSNGRKISWASAFGGAIALSALLVTGHASWTHDRETDVGILIALMLGFALVLLAMVLLYARLRETHRQAKQTETAFKMAVQSLSDGFAIIDRDGRVVLSNDRLRAMLPDQDDLGALRDLATHDEEQRLDDGRWVLHRAHDLPDGGRAIVYTDISALKRREQAILDHASRYRDMVERSPIPIYVHRDRIVVYANTATARVLGYGTPGDIVGKNIFDLIHPDHHKLLQRRLKQVADLNERLNQVDMQYVRKDGTPIHTEAQVSPVVFDGEPALESTLYDVSARRTAERAMRESEQRYRNLFELSPDAIIVHDGESILFANDTAAQMFGAERDIDLFGMDIDALQGGGASDCTLAVTDGAATGPSAQQTCRLHRLDGEPFDAEIVVAPTPHHGQIVQQAVIRDVTRRKRMDAAMTQNAKLAALGGMVAGLAHELSQPLNIMRFAAEGGLLKMAKGTIDDAGHAKNYHLVQDQAERMAQVMDNMRIFSRKETRPMGTFDLALAVRNICHLVRNPFRVDDVHIQTEGPASGIWATGSAIQFEQVMLNLLTNARDSILEHRHRLDLDEPGRITIELRDDVDDIAVSVTDNGSGIITHMRTYSRQDTEGQIPFKPGHAVLDGCNLFSAQLLGDDIAFDVDVEKDLPLVKGHANRLEQVILNLLSNARDAIKMRREKGIPGDDDRIRVVVRADRENANLIIRVEDTGGGVPKEVLPHIFAPFVTTKDSGRGTGLGLSISFGIIEGMDGTIEVMNLTRGSRVEGARFSIQLPFAEEQTVPVPIPGDFPAGAPGGDAPPAVAARTDGAPQGNGIEKVLVVDDEVGAAHSLSDFLQEMGYLVYTAYNGEEALRLFESDPADVVISDLRMPVMSGEDLARALRADDVAVPIFIMTGHGTGDGGVRVPDGATDVWRKPLSLTDVAQKLQAL